MTADLDTAAPVPTPAPAAAGLARGRPASCWPASCGRCCATRSRVVFGMVQPLVFLALFGPLLVGSLGGQAAPLGGSVWQWFVPAILVMTALFGTSTTGVQPAVRDPDRRPRTDAGHPAVPAVAAHRPGAEGDGAAGRRRR